MLLNDLHRSLRKQRRRVRRVAAAARAARGGRAGAVVYSVPRGLARRAPQHLRAVGAALSALVEAKVEAFRQLRAGRLRAAARNVSEVIYASSKILTYNPTIICK